MKYLALGDSYTIGESVNKNESWPFVLMQYLTEKGYEVQNPCIIAKTGWTTSELLDALQSNTIIPPYDLVFLLIGVNNQYQDLSKDKYRDEFSLLLDKAVACTGNNPEKVMVLSIPDYGYTLSHADHQSDISREIDEYNAINESLSADKGAQYHDITKISRRGMEDPGLVADDELHPSGKQYARWVQDFGEKVVSMISR